MCVSSLQQSDYPYNENVPSIKIPMDMMEQEPFLGDKASDSEQTKPTRSTRGKLLLPLDPVRFSRSACVSEEFCY